MQDCDSEPEKLAWHSLHLHLDIFDNKIVQLWCACAIMSFAICLSTEIQDKLESSQRKTKQKRVYDLLSCELDVKIWF